MNTIAKYKNPLNNQYVCPEGFHFMWNDLNMGRIIWTCQPESYYVKKDEDNTDEDSK